MATAQDLLTEALKAMRLSQGHADLAHKAVEASSLPTGTKNTVAATIAKSSGDLNTAIKDIVAFQNPPAPPANPITVSPITGLSLKVGTAADIQLRATSTAGTIEWDVTGTLPPGMDWAGNLDISGTPTAAGSFPISGSVKDSAGNSVPVSFTIAVAGVPAPPPTPSGTFDSILSVYPGSASSVALAQKLGLKKFNYRMYFGTGNTIAEVAQNALDGCGVVGNENKASGSFTTLIAAFNLCTQNQVSFPGSSGPTLADAATGAMDATAKQFGLNLVAGGQPNAHIRIGWEQNLPTGPWGVNGADTTGCANYIKACQRVYTILKATPGSNFTICTFNPALNIGNYQDSALNTYPGDDYTDYIAIDLYDQAAWGVPYPGYEAAWNEYVGTVDGSIGLAWLANMAKEHNKRPAILEWGLGYNESAPSSGGFSGDDAYFVNQGAAWAIANNAIIMSIWCDGGGSGAQDVPSTNNPNATAALKALVAA